PSPQRASPGADQLASGAARRCAGRRTDGEWPRTGVGAHPGLRPDPPRCRQPGRNAGATPRDAPRADSRQAALTQVSSTRRPPAHTQYPEDPFSSTRGGAMMPAVIGFDIGGANTKAAHSGGVGLIRPFALWKDPETVALRLVLRELRDALPPAG